MRFSTIATALLAPLCAQAVVMFTNNAYAGIVAGAPFNLTWSGDSTPVTIDLLNGPPQMLLKVDAIANDVIGSSYLWTPLETLQAGLYALSITQSGSTNYSPQFSIASKSVSTPLPTPPVLLALPSSTMGRAILTSTLSLPPTSKNSAQQYPSPGPIWAAVSDFNTSSTTSYAHTRYINTIKPTTPVIMGSSTWLYATALMNSTVPGHSGRCTPIATSVVSSFKGGATRLGGLGLGLSLAAMFAGTILASYAF